MIMRQRAHIATLRRRETSFEDLSGEVFSKIELKIFSMRIVVWNVCTDYDTIRLDSVAGLWIWDSYIDAVGLVDAGSPFLWEAVNY